MLTGNDGNGVGKRCNELGSTGRYAGPSHYGQVVALNTTWALTAGEVINLTDAIRINAQFFK